MTQRIVSIRGLDTLLFRDGRPFDATPGGVASGLRVPFPSTLAGFVRTQAGQATGDYGKARTIEFAGPLLCLNGEPHFPAPADIVIHRDNQSLRLMPLRPFAPAEGSGCDNPGGMLPLRVTGDVKPEAGYDWWRANAMFQWLADELPDVSDLARGLGPEMDERVHIAMDAQKGTTQEGALFTTSMVAFELNRKGEHIEYSYLCRLSEPEGVAAPLGPGLLGGEQRIGLIESTTVQWPEYPVDLAAKLKVAKHVRLVLATPAIFECGWLPQWLDRTTKTGSPPGLKGVKLKLVSAAIPRRQAVSGWEMEGKRPKPVRWLVPAGSVYFFDVVEGDPGLLATRKWLEPVSDLEHGNGSESKANNLNDGFGLALWGVWQRERKNV